MVVEPQCRFSCPHRNCWVLLPAPGALGGGILVLLLCPFSTRQLQNSLWSEISRKYKVCHCQAPPGMEGWCCCSGIAAGPVPELLGVQGQGWGSSPPGNVGFELSGSPQAAAPLAGACWDVWAGKMQLFPGDLHPWAWGLSPPQPLVLLQGHREPALRSSVSRALRALSPWNHLEKDSQEPLTGCGAAGAPTMGWVSREDQPGLRHTQGGEILGKFPPQLQEGAMCTCISLSFPILLHFRLELLG